MDVTEQPVQAATPKRRRPWLLWAAPVIALIAGIALGNASAGTDPTASPEYQALEQQLVDTRGDRDQAEERAAASSREVATAAEEAAAETRQQAEDDLAAREAELDQREADVAEREEAVTAAEQAPELAPEPAPAPEREPAPALEPDLSSGQSNAMGQAQNYLDMSGFSRSGLIGQLEFEGYSTADATAAVDSLGVDWKQQAARKAEEYLDMMSFSRQGLVDQLVFEGFTAEQAEYGASQAY